MSTTDAACPVAAPLEPVPLRYVADGNVLRLVLPNARPANNPTGEALKAARSELWSTLSSTHQETAMQFRAAADIRDRARRGRSVRCWLGDLEATAIHSNSRRVQRRAIELLLQYAPERLA